nr:protein-L-isoaspartate(D-aspartate) O-methyltransferase [Streptomyces sp. CBMA123]
MGRFLLDSGTLTCDWAPAFAALPRHLFLPDLFWAYDMATGTSVAVNKATDPARWLAAAESDIPIVTQWDDGDHQGEQPGSVSTSSASMPSVVAAMLADLDVEPGMRVYEGGTGTGWNAALLAHRLGDTNVVTGEVDDAVAAAAKHRLKAAGLNPVVHTGDALTGCPDAGPYDRTIVTFGLREMPFPLIAQTKPGGIILAPWGTHYSTDDALVRLTVAADGIASGPFLRPVAFMKARSQRHVWAAPQDMPAAESTTDVPWIGHGQFDPYPFVLGLRLPTLTHAVQVHENGQTLWLYALSGSSWASATFRDGAPTVVRQAGPRRLWEEFEVAHHWWVENGEPGLDRVGLTVDSDGQLAWLDDPANCWAI